MENEQNESNSDVIEVFSLWKSSRLLYSVFAFLATTNTMTMRINLSFAMICMVKNPVFNITQIQIARKLNSKKILMEIYFDKKISDHDVQCFDEVEKLKFEDMGEFYWTKQMQGYILGSFFIGYILTQAIAGWLCDRFGGKLFFIVGNLSQSICTLLIPIAARYSPFVLITLRAVQGLFCGLVIPSVYQLFGKWAHPNERVKLIGIAFVGYPFASFMIFPISACFCNMVLDNGWPFIFYVPGTFSIICTIISIWCVYNNPNCHPRISKEEKAYLTNNNTSKTIKKLKIPWKNIFTSVPIQVYNITHFCHVWGHITLSLVLPMYLKEVLYFTIEMNGILASIHYLFNFFVRLCIIFGYRYVWKKSKLQLLTFRKINHFIGSFVPAMCYVAVTFFTCDNRYIILGILCLASLSLDFGFLGSYLLTLLELAPPYIGLLTGISNTIGSIPGIISPLIIGYITTNNSRSEWNIIMYIIAGLYLCGGFTYIIFGTDKLQPWAA